MLTNYLKIAWRSLLKNKEFTFINIMGLSIGVAACVLISIYIVHEASYDKKIADSDHIYRMVNRYVQDGRINDGIHFSANTARTVLADFPEVLQTGRLMDNELFWGAGSNEMRIEGEQKQHHEEGFTYADQAIIDIMKISMVHGVAESALAEPNTIVISESVSNKYFGNENPLGKVLFLNGNNSLPFRINGVMKDFSSNSHLDYDFLITLKGVEFEEGEQTRWLQNNYFTYITLRPDADAKAFEKKMSTHLIEDYIVPASDAAGYVIPDDYRNQFFIKLQPLTDINLYSSTIGFESSKRNDIKIIWIFGIIALFVLVIAGINFVNLSTAKSANRAKEVGVRKVVGSSKSYLVQQFLTESVLITIISFALGILLSWALMPIFRGISGKELEMPFSNPQFYLTTILGAIIVGVLAGLYPSFYLSRFQPASVLKGKLSSGSKSSRLRSSLVVFQFTISIILIIGTLIVNQQMNFILNSKLGFEKDQVIQLYGTNLMEDQLPTFKEELKKINGIESVSVSDFLPIEGTKRNGNSFVNEGRDNIDEAVSGQAWVIDEDYLETMGMTLVLGRNFIKDRASDENATIVNETMVKKLLLKDPIGKKISRYGNIFEIIGVVKDFNFNTLQQTVEPLCFFRGISSTITSLKVKSSDLSGLITSIEKKWTTFNPNMEMRYEFMDNSFAKMYTNVSQIKSIFISFAVLAIFVACLGLFALSAFMVEQRKKEISIRLVLGAPFKSIYTLLTLNFLKLVFIAIAIAIPVGWLLMSRWLEDFTYKIVIGWEIFALA
ncbi:MAG: ABC transporter permease, partial [Eudoraea sp.]